MNVLAGSATWTVSAPFARVARLALNASSSSATPRIWRAADCNAVDGLVSLVETDRRVSVALRADALVQGGEPVGGVTQEGGVELDLTNEVGVAGEVFVQGRVFLAIQGAGNEPQ